MNKIPVGATIARAYRFAFKDFLKILGVVWLPLAIMSAFSLAFSARLLALQETITTSPAAAGPLLLYLIPFYILIFILLFMQAIGIAELALGLRQGPSWFYFSLGKPLWRLIGSVLLLILAFIIAYVLLALALLLLGALGGYLAGAIPGAAAFFVLLVLIAGLVLWCGYVYALVRLTFLLTPVIAARENGFALERAWKLGKGNFWRMFAIMLAVMLPFIILELTCLFGFVWHGLPIPPPGATPAQMAAFDAAMQAQTLEMMEHMYRYWYIAFPAFAVFSVLFYGAITGAQAFAYQALTQDPDASSSLP